MTIKEIYDRCMPAEKRKKERMNIWVAWVVRPLSVLWTAPFVNTKIRPSDITILSIVFSVVGYFLMAFGGNDMVLKLSGWLCFFIWAILDGVDGNLARCQNTCSPMGEMWDALGGYASMVLIYLAASVSALFDDNIINCGANYLPLITGGACAVMSIFPRLIMHRKNNVIPPKKTEKALNDKANYGLKEIIAMNVVSVSGFMQVIFLAAILTHTLNIFVYFYTFVNFAIMMMSLRSLMKSE